MYIRPIQKNSFHLIEGTMCTFYKLKMLKNGSNHFKFPKTVFYEQDLDFHRPSKILCRTSGRQNQRSLQFTYTVVQ
jgi:hypothetical protein